MKKCSNNYNPSPKDIITNYKLLLGAHENVLQNLPSPFNNVKLIPFLFACDEEKTRLPNFNDKPDMYLKPARIVIIPTIKDGHLLEEQC